MRMQDFLAARYSRNSISHLYAEREKEATAVVDNAFPYRSTLAESENHRDTVSDLSRRLQKVDFAITETVLYLDAYPSSQEALAYYHKLITERDMLNERLAALGKPTTHFDNTAKDQWLWTKGPWPWQIEAN